MPISTEKMKLSFYGATADDENYWFCDINTNCLFRMNKISKEIRLENVLFNLSSIVKGMYSAITYINGMLILAPFNARDIVIYSIKTKEIERINIEIPESLSESCYDLFRNIVVINNNVYFIPGRYPAILKLCLEDHMLEIIDDFMPDVYEYNMPLSESDHIFCLPFTKDEERVLIPGNKNCFVLDINFSTNKYSVNSIGEYKNGISSLVMVSNKIYYSVIGEKRLVIYDGKHSESLEIQDSNPFCTMYWLLLINNYVYAIPNKGNTLIKISTQTKNIEKYIFVEKSPSLNDSIIRCCKIADNILLSFESGEIILFETLNCHAHAVRYELSDEEMYLLKTAYSKTFTIESGGSLEHFIKLIGNDNQIVDGSNDIGYIINKHINNCTY